MRLKSQIWASETWNEYPDVISELRSPKHSSGYLCAGTRGFRCRILVLDGSPWMETDARVAANSDGVRRCCSIP
jgi:hypothetical protein